MGKLLSLALSKGGVRYGAGGLLAASGLVLLAGLVSPDAGQSEQIGGAALLVSGILAALLAPKVEGAIKNKLGGNEEEVKS